MSIGHVIRAPGRVVLNPTDLSGEFPYGGTALGSLRQCALAPLGANYVVQCEGLGRPSDILHGTNRFLLSFFLRGWDDAALATLLPTSAATGATTQHQTLAAPATQNTGGTALARAASFLVVPDDTVAVPCVLIYRGVVRWSAGAELMWQRREELGLPLSVECLRDGTSRVLQVGRLEDLTL